MKKALLLLLVAFAVFACNPPTNNPDDDPTENPEAALVESDIGSSGGIIETDGITLIIPPESFSSTVHVQIFSGVDSINAFGDNTVTELYRIEGLPEDFTKPIEVAIKYSGSLANENYLAVGSELESEESDENVISYAVYEAHDSSGMIVSSIEPLVTSTSSGPTLKKSLPGESLLILMGITNMTSHDSRFFRVTHPFTAEKQRIIRMADYMDAAMDTFHLMKLVDKEVAQRLFMVKGKPKIVVTTINPLKTYSYLIHMPELGPMSVNMTSEEEAERKSSMLQIKFNIPQMLLQAVREDQLISLCYYWVYRMLYFTYYGDNMDWFALASSFWIMEKHSGRLRYQPDKFPDSGVSPFFGMEKGLEQSGSTEVYTYPYGKYSVAVTNHAHSMSPLIKYLDKTYPQDKEMFLRIIKEIIKGKSETPAEGIINAIEDPEYVWWPGFFKDFLTKKLYDISADKFLQTVNSQNNINFPREIDTTIYNDDIYADLSAKLFRINFVFDEFKEDASLNLKLGPSGLNFDYVTAMAFGLKDGSLDYLDHSTDLTIPDLAALKQNGYQSIVVAVINSGNEPPFNETRGITLDSRLVIAPKDFNWIIFRVKARATYIDNDGASSEGTFIYSDAELRTGEMVGNKFTATWSEPLSSGTSSGTIEIVFDLNRFPNYVTSYTVTETQKLSDTRTYTITGENIELYGYKDYSGAYSYSVSGEGAKDYISSLDHVYSGEGGYGYSTDGVPITDGSSFIEIRMGTFE